MTGYKYRCFALYNADPNPRPRCAALFFSPQRIPIRNALTLHPFCPSTQLSACHLFTPLSTNPTALYSASTILNIAKKLSLNLLTSTTTGLTGSPRRPPQMILLPRPALPLRLNRIQLIVRLILIATLLALLIIHILQVHLIQPEI